jgi:hypothetical protein
MSNEDPSNRSNSRRKYEADKIRFEKQQRQMEVAAIATGSLNLNKRRTNSEKHRVKIGLPGKLIRTNTHKQFIKALSKHPVANYRQHLASGETLTTEEARYYSNNHNKTSKNIENRVRKILLKKEEKRQKKKKKERQNINKNQNELLETFGGRRKKRAKRKGEKGEKGEKQKENGSVIEERKKEGKNIKLKYILKF